MINKESHLLTLKETADILNVSWQTIRNYIKTGKLKAYRLGESKDYRVNPVDLNEFLNMHYLATGKSDSLSSAAKSLIEFEKISLSKNCTLVYSGKMPEAQIIESIEDINLVDSHGNKVESYLDSLIIGDNKQVLKKLLAEYSGKIDLVYIDPPFGTNREFSDYDKTASYSDDITNEEYLEFLRQRLILLRELLSERGSIYVHIDKKMGHYVKIIMDEIFGERNFINEITRIKCNPKNFSRKAYGNYTDLILFYAKNKDKNIWNDVTIPLTKSEEVALFPKTNAFGRRYTTHPLHAPGVTINGSTGDMWRGMSPPVGRHWRYKIEDLERLYEDGLIEISSTGNPRKIVYAMDHKGKKPQDIWEFKDKGAKFSDYPTEKNREMIEFIIRNSSSEESIVLDAFAGSFSTCVEAAKLGRNFIGIDVSEASLDVGIKKFGKAKKDFNIIKAEA